MINYLNSSNKKINFIQKILSGIHNKIEFSASDHRYKVEKNILTKDGVKTTKISPFSVSKVVHDNFESFNEAFWDIPSNKSGIAVSELVYNKLLAQTMGCVKGTIIHDYLENFASGKSELNVKKDITERIRNETKSILYPKLKDSNNFLRRVTSNPEKLNIEKEMKTFPKLPLGVLTLDIQNINLINQLVVAFSENFDNKDKNLSPNEFIKICKEKYNFPENTLNELEENISLFETINSEKIYEAFSSLKDNSILGSKEFLFSCQKLDIENSLYLLKNNPDSKEIKSDLKIKINQLNNTFLLNPEITAKTVHELKKEEYRLNKDTSLAVQEVFKNLNANDLFKKLEDQNINIIAVEQKMCLGPVIGTADIIGATNDGEIIILDYKTNKGVLSQESLEHYSLQLRIYDKMVKDLVKSEIVNSPELQKECEKVFGGKWKNIVNNVICVNKDPLILHISSVGKILESDIDKIKAIGIRNIFDKSHNIEFLSDKDKHTFFQNELAELNNKIIEKVNNVSSSKIIESPENCIQYKDHKKTVTPVIDVINDVFNKNFTEIRTPNNHIYLKNTDLVVLDTPNNRSLSEVKIDPLKSKEFENLIKKLDVSNEKIIEKKTPLKKVKNDIIDLTN